MVLSLDITLPPDREEKAMEIMRRADAMKTQVTDDDESYFVMWDMKTDEMRIITLQEFMQLSSRRLQREFAVSFRFKGHDWFDDLEFIRLQLAI